MCAIIHRETNSDVPYYEPKTFRPFVSVFTTHCVLAATRVFVFGIFEMIFFKCYGSIIKIYFLSNNSLIIRSLVACIVWAATARKLTRSGTLVYSHTCANIPNLRYFWLARGTQLSGYGSYTGIRTGLKWSL